MGFPLGRMLKPGHGKNPLKPHLPGSAGMAAGGGAKPKPKPLPGGPGGNMRAAVVRTQRPEMERPARRPNVPTPKPMPTDNLGGGRRRLKPQIPPGG